MKHKILILGAILSCLLGLTACGESAVTNSVEGSRYSPDIFNEANIKAYVESLEDSCFENWYLRGVTPDNFENSLYFEIGESVGDEEFETIKNGYESWYKVVDDLGYNSLETLQSDIRVGAVEYSVNDDGVLVVDAEVTGTKHSSDMTLYLTNKGVVTDLGITLDRTLGEKLQNAGLNTLLGMGMAFVILIIISLIISLFPLIFGGGKKKKESDKEIAQKAMENTINQIAEQEDLSSDAELVAVIAAAIAAYEGSAGTDGFRVRSIRKVNSNWKR